MQQIDENLKIKNNYLFQHIASSLVRLQPGHEHQHRLWLTAKGTATSYHTDLGKKTSVDFYN